MIITSLLHPDSGSHNPAPGRGPDAGVGLTVDAYVATLLAENAALAAAGRRGLGASVPGCPGWTVAHAIRHVGSGHRWVEEVLRARTRNGFDVAMPEAPSDGELVRWLEEGCERLAITFREVPPATPTCAMWTPDGMGTAGFWIRRVPHHVAEHRWDAESAHGEAAPVAADVAADALDQILVSWLPWAARVGRQAQGEWSGESVHFHRCDGPGDWLVRLEAAGTVEVSRQGGRADLTVTGTASDLFLLVMNRIPLGSPSLGLHGDTVILTRWTEEIRWGTAANRPPLAEVSRSQHWSG